MKILEIDNLVRNYKIAKMEKDNQDVKVLKEISFDVCEGEFLGIMG